ncbi:MAG: ATP-binding protein [Bacteroidota bacterium]
MDTLNATITREDLAQFDTFEGLPDTVLDWIIEHGEVQAFAPGDTVAERGAEAERMFVLIDGMIEFRFSLGGQLMTSGVWEPGSVTGLLPFSRMQNYSGAAIATAPSRLLFIHRDHFPDLIYQSHELGRRLVGIMSDRVRLTTKNAQQREKMMALGKLSAGLAHELNNPAAAVRRAVEVLRERQSTLPKLAARVASLGVTHAQLCQVDSFRERVESRRAAVSLSTMERSEREDEVADWLEERNVAEPWMVAETVVDAGLGVDDLAEVSACVPAEAFPDVVKWLEGGLAADGLLNEIDAAASRISELVASVKSYSHMDRNPNKQLVDVREGLDSTLTMLGHKLKKKAIAIERRYTDVVPEVEAYVGELNQVWTNLIDNAIDAMGDGGTLTLDVSPQHTYLRICVIDDGQGIPLELQSRIFEPFFSTKEVGEGTGLGLDVVQRIIRRNHGGEVEVSSEPGRTSFEVRLPLPQV